MTKVSEPYKVGPDSKLTVGLTITLQDVCMTKFHGSSPYGFEGKRPKRKNLTKVSEPYKVGPDSKLTVGLTITLQDVCMTKFHGSSPYSFRQSDLNVKTEKTSVNRKQ